VPEHPENHVDRLATFRLERGLSFEQLAEQMTEAGYPIRPRALHLALTGRLVTAPRETTLYKIQQFVETQVGRRRASRNGHSKRRRRAVPA